ncbi:hypothetical protein FZEAL_6109 [Fusarium zealandicum]|uniref:BRCT domain-containing protein n=1 Tax=Fusarium zealandicum TaxID=1053134 RepID=A0A8H4UIQ4_9HYPO|nr:hypothetical protein FZEAL_6109 [Fusarium zealandicum]
MAPQIFKGRVLAAAGPLPGQFTIENLKHWTKIRKGNFRDDFDEDVTHLLCTRDQFNKKVPRVKEALKRGKRLHIVHFDWFEYSTVKNKRLPENEFSMRNILAKQNAKRREEARAEKGRRDGENFVNTTLYHIYRDRTNFVYQIDLTRDDEATGAAGQKYTLCLWESNATPHLYWFTARFLKGRGNTQPSYHRPSSYAGKWRPEFNLFMDFFKLKTGVPWVDRVSLAKTMPSSYFQYAPPEEPNPLGRRLAHSSEYCRQINAEMRGLPWPPVKETKPEEESTGEGPGDGPVSFEDSDENANGLVPRLDDGQLPERDDISSARNDDAKIEPGDIEVGDDIQSPLKDTEVDSSDDSSTTPLPIMFDFTSPAEATSPSSQLTESDSEP